MTAREQIARSPWVLYLLGGFALGGFIGYQILPKLVHRPATPLAAVAP